MKTHLFKNGLAGKKSQNIFKDLFATIHPLVKIFSMKYFLLDSEKTNI